MACHYCKKTIGILAEYIVVREAIKPPRHQGRWKNVGRMCGDCESKGINGNIDRYKTK